MKYTVTNDAEIWNRFKKGDDDALSSIYQVYSRKLYRYGLKFTPKQATIEDTIQELFLELIRNRKSLGDTDNILAYLLLSFRRKLFRQIKKENRFLTGRDHEEYQFDIVYSVEHDLILDEVADSRLFRISNMLKSLKPRQKEAIYLKFTVGMAYEDISEIMEMNVESCRNLVYRAIRTLRSTIGNEE